MSPGHSTCHRQKACWTRWYPVETHITAELCTLSSLITYSTSTSPHKSSLTPFAAQHLGAKHLLHRHCVDHTQPKSTSDASNKHKTKELQQKQHNCFNSQNVHPTNQSGGEKSKARENGRCILLLVRSADNSLDLRSASTASQCPIFTTTSSAS